MIKFIAATVWICAATLGAVFYSFQIAGSHGVGEKPKPMLGGLDYVKTDIISVPLVRDARIDGYFLTKLVYTVEPEQIKKLSIPAEALITDQVYSYLYANPQIDFTRKETVDLDAFRRHCLLNGLDDIGLTMEKAPAIASFEAKNAASRPWA